MAFIIDDLLLGIIRTVIALISLLVQISAGMIGIATRDAESMTAVVFLLIIFLYLLWFTPASLSDYVSIITPFK